MAGTKPSTLEVKEHVRRVAATVGVPTDWFMALCEQESGFNTNAKSRAGALGVCQIMPGTAAGIAKRYNKQYANLDVHDWQDTVLMGALYLKERLAQFKGSVPLALASYNAGPGAVQKYGGIPPYKETQNYVRVIKALRDRKYSNETTMRCSWDKGSLRDKRTGKASVEGFSNLADIISGSNEATGDWIGIRTNLPELLEDRPEYSDYADLRRMTINGSPLFQKGDYPCELVRKAPTEFTGFQNGVEEGIAAELASTQNYNYAQESPKDIQALLMTFQDRYSTMPPEDDIGAAFGMANLTYDDYVAYDMTGDQLANPVLQGRTLVNEYQKARYFFDDSEMAFHALAGGQFISDSGEKTDWNTLKNNEDRYNSKWYKTYSDDTNKKNIQELYGAYQDYRKAIV